MTGSTVLDDLLENGLEGESQREREALMLEEEAYEKTKDKEKHDQWPRQRAGGHPRPD